jgi:hypothetical protein
MFFSVRKTVYMPTYDQSNSIGDESSTSIVTQKMLMMRKKYMNFPRTQLTCNYTKKIFLVPFPKLKKLT